MSSKNFYGLTGDVTVDGGILNVGNAQLYANTGTSNVGIGTSNPEFELDVHGNANVGVLYSTFLHGDGSNIQNIVSSQWEGSPGDPIYYASNVGIANTSPVTKTLQVGSNLYVEDAGSNVLHVTGNIYADYLVGDGSQLTGIAASLDQIVDQGNTVSNTIQIVSGQDATSNVGLVTHEGVSISVSNANPTGEFQFGVGSNLLVNVYSSNVLTVDGNVFAQKMTLGTVTVTPAYNLQQIMTAGATSDQTLVLSNVTTGLTADANIVVNGNVTAGSVITSGNVNAGNVITSTNIEVGGDLSVTGNVYIDDMRVAEVASNLVTYDSTTGELMDSGGLFSNKLAVVSEQPPIALTGASTVVTNHGTYTIEASSGTVVNLFDKVIGEINKWETDGNYSTDVGTEGNYNGSASLAGYDGEWAKITMPYKTILRHVKIESTNESVEDIELVGLNADGLTWSNLKTETGLTGTTHTIVVNATTHHRTYGLIVEKTNTTTGRSAVEIGDLKLFTESFSIDGGKVEMASSAIMGGETTMEQSGPHGRGEAKLKKYPEIDFTLGKFEGTPTGASSDLVGGPYIQGGYEVSGSRSYYDSGNPLFAWQVFSGYSIRYQSARGDYTAVDGGYVGTIQQTIVSGSAVNGEWLQLKTPNKIKLKRFTLALNLSGYDGRKAKSFVIAGSNDGTTWITVSTHTDTPLLGGANGADDPYDSNSTEYYKYHRLIVTHTHVGASQNGPLALTNWGIYGYEEDPPAGDTSVDTTFTSIMNTPQTTGAQVYVDGSLGETFTNRVVGPTVSNTHTTYVSAEKYWELSGNVESNVTIEANTFLSGDQPHAVSVWFNSSNLEANVSNSCIFSLATEEKLDSVNLDLQSNTWHNLTYAYQGEGGSRVTYLDGRKVAEDQAEDTFGEYPPFAMTGYSQGGYVASASSENNGITQGFAYLAFDGIADGTRGYHSASTYSSGVYQGGAKLTGPGPIDYDGEWIKLELPHKIKVTGVSFAPRISVNPGDNYSTRIPYKGYILGSNTGSDGSWELVHSFDNVTTTEGVTKRIDFTGTNEYYKHIAMVAEEVAPDATFGTVLNFSEMEYYGHRENDLVRLPDPTNVLKYPHVALTGPAQRGYVASASSLYLSGGQAIYPGWEAFDHNTSNNNRWASENAQNYNGGSFLYSGNKNLGTDNGGSGTPNGEWLMIEMSHKIKLHSTKLIANGNALEVPDKFIIYGSNNLTGAWSVVDNTYETTSAAIPFGETGKTWTVSTSASPVAYKYFGLVVRNTTGSTYITTVNEWELYGTGVDSVPLQIGGGNIDKVANFRVYDKFIGEDQALEIWDAQKDAFGRAKSSMTLQKGRLGIGTDEPQGRLAVLDEPHNLEEFPPSPMTGYKNYFEGHGEFCVKQSSVRSGYSGASAIFDKDTSTYWHTNNTSNDHKYTQDAEGNYIGVSKLAGLNGEWVILECPYGIKLETIKLQLRALAYQDQSPKDWSLLGSDDGYDWVTLKQVAGHIIPDTGSMFNVSATRTYKMFALVVTRIANNVAGSFTNALVFGEWKLFGTREQGQSVLHDGQLTLTKSLNVPRIGPALDADDTPRRDRLVVEYNTSTNPTFEGAVRDTSGRGNDGVFYNGATYNANEKAFTFVGSSSTTANSSDKIQSTYDWGSTAPAHTFSVWFKRTANLTDWEWICSFGRANNTGGNPGILMSGDTYSGGANLISFDTFNDQVITTHAVPLGVWTHVVATFNAASTAWSPDNCKIYVNGVLTPGTNEEVGNLNVVGNEITLGATHEGKRGFTGNISNFKLYDVALTAEEVKTLYDMGRCDEGHHVVNFSKTRVGIGLGDGEAPRSALDVRGDLYVNNNLVVGRYVGFSAYRSSSTTGDANPVVWNEVWTKSIEFNDVPNTTGFYRIPYTGKYLFTFYCIATSNIVMTLFKSSTASISGRTSTQHVPYDDKGTGEGTWLQLNGNGIEDFTAGEYVHVMVNASFYGQPSAPHNGFSLTFLGA